MLFVPSLLELRLRKFWLLCEFCCCQSFSFIFSFRFTFCSASPTYINKFSDNLISSSYDPSEFFSFNQLLYLIFATLAVRCCNIQLFCPIFSLLIRWSKCVRVQFHILLSKNWLSLSEAEDYVDYVTTVRPHQYLIILRLL